MSNENLKTTFTKFLRPINPILVKNYNVGSNLKIGHFWPNMVVWFTDYNDKVITDKNAVYGY